MSLLYLVAQSPMDCNAGYGRFGGSKAHADDLSKIFSIMEENGLLHPERLLTGMYLFIKDQTTPSSTPERV